jgi:hypothetical protein
MASITAWGHRPPRPLHASTAQRVVVSGARHRCAVALALAAASIARAGASRVRVGGRLPRRCWVAMVMRTIS